MNDTFMTFLLMSLTGSALAIALFLLKPIIRNHVSKAFLYYIWLPVLLRLIVPFGFAVNVAYETPTAPSIAPVSAESVEPAINIPIPENAVPVLPGDTGGPFTVTVTPPEMQTPSSVETTPTTVTETDAAPKTEEKFDFTQSLLDNLGYIWLMGAAVSFGWYLISYAVFYRRLSRSFASPGMADLEVFNSMRRTGKVRLVTSAETKTPMHMGAFRPVIVLPQIDYTASGMEKELRDVLRHELTHWRRHDIFYKWFAVLVQSVHWFNPFVYFIRREIDKSSELSCDEAVVRGLSEQDRISYGNTLLTLASEHAIPNRITATTLSEGKKQLKERIISIRDYKTSSHAMVALMLVIAIALTGCATAIAAVGTDTAQSQKAETASISGWIHGDDAVLTYVMEHYDIDGKKIVNGTYQETGRRDGGDYKRYMVGTEDDGTYLLTARGELKPHYFLFRDTGQRGPEFRVTGISFAVIPPYSTVPAPPVSDSPFKQRAMTLDDVRRLAEKGEDLDWADFAGYESREVGSGLYILRYEVDDMFFVLVGGGWEDERAWYIDLIAEAGDTDVCDLRAGVELLEEYIARHAIAGFPRTFTYGSLAIEVSSVLGTGTASYTDDMAETHEYPVYICAPDAVATVYGADMDDPAYAEDKKAHAQWAFYTETWERTDIVDGMAPITVFETLAVCHIESSTPVLKLEIPVKDSAGEDAVTRAVSAGDRTLTVEAVGRGRVDGISGWGIGTLNIYDGDNLIQSITMSEAIERDGVSGPIAPGYTEAWDRESAFYTQDINFDGKDDIVVMGWIPNNTIPYYCYLWNDDRGQYEYAFILQGLSVDPEKKEVISEYHTSGENYEYRYDHYQYDKEGKLVLVNRVVG